MVKNPNENLIHLRFMRLEAINAKKDILSSEINMLKIAKKIGNYKELKIKELAKRDKIAQKLKNIRLDIIKINKILPKLKIPKILEAKEIKENIINDEDNDDKIKIYGTIEEQLIQIQKKLKALEYS